MYTTAKLVSEVAVQEDHWVDISPDIVIPNLVDPVSDLASADPALHGEYKFSIIMQADFWPTRTYDACPVPTT